MTGKPLSRIRLIKSKTCSVSLTPSAAVGSVHDHQHLAEHRGTSDGDRLPLPTGKTLHRLSDVLNGGDAQRVELFLCLGSHGIAVEYVQSPQQTAATDFAAQKQIRRD